MLKFLPDLGHDVSSWIAASQASLIGITFCEEIYESENILTLMVSDISAKAFQMCHGTVPGEYHLLCCLTTAERVLYVYRQIKSLLLVLFTTPTLF